MNKFKDETTQTRILQLLKVLIERPFGYTKIQLAELLQVSTDSIKRYFNTLRNAGFEIKINEHFRYGIENDKTYQYLQELLLFSEKDQEFILKTLEDAEANDKQKNRILSKMQNIYDFTRLGGHLISSQFMTKMNILEQAMQERKVVELIDYRSSYSGTVSNKLVEPFHILPKLDILHAFDIQEREVRHYRISRITRVEISDMDWNPKNTHIIMATDPFRISDSKQVQVRIRLTVGGRNEIEERFPATSGYIQAVADQKDIFELDCMVNAKFRGLSNFLLGNFHFITEIIEPESLIEHINNEAKKINF